jgi:uncharacterized protein YkwD
LRSIRTVADLSALFESLGTLLSSHRAVTRVSLAALSFTLIVAFTQQSAPTIQAGPEPEPLVPESLLPQSVGTAIASDDSITIPFDATVDADAVDAAIQVLPAQKFRTSWNADATELTISPERLWRTDERYLVVVPAGVIEPAAGRADGPRRYAFTTQTAPAVTDFQARLAGPAADADAEVATEALAVEATDRGAESPGTQPPDQTPKDVSATSEITVSFSVPMDQRDVEEHFLISPAIDGELSWKGGDLVFAPSGRLEPGSRYTISVIGAHDRIGNPIGGKANFSFVVQPGAQVTKTQPETDATDVEPATVEMWFSQPMDVDATNKAFALTDTATGALVGGLLNWNEAGTQLTYTPDQPFAGGRTFKIRIGKGARDADGNAVTASWSFTTMAAPVVEVQRTTTTTRSAPAPAPAPITVAPSTSLAGYALNQVNAARAAYGFAPVVLDAKVSAAASAHAWDQANNNYFSHYSLDGRSREDRLRAAGVSFSWSGENQCYHLGMSQQATLEWCHTQFMAEPYPGEWNHIANILNPNARRMGIGIATVGSKTIITWNFAD